MNRKIILYCTALILGLLISVFFQGTPTLQAEERPEMSPELTECLKSKMGEEVFANIKSGSRQPTSEEAEKSEECFQNTDIDYSKSGSGRPGKPNFSAETKACLSKTLGPDYENQFMAVKSREEGEKLSQKAKNCFGGPPAGSDKMPDQVKTCIVGQVGQAEADKIFKGERPSSDSDVYQKLEKAGCFKSFQHNNGRGPREELSADKKQCVESIMGRMDAEPTEEQKKQVGEKCFGGQGRPQLPSAVESCLKEKLGSAFMEKAKENLSEAEGNAANECFSQNNFRPEGMSDSRRPDMPDATKSCIERVTGQTMTGPMQLDDQTKNRVNTECFGGRADEITGEGGARGKTRTEVDECANRITGGAPGPYSSEIQNRLNQECYREQPADNNPRTAPDKQACIDRITSDTSVQMSYEEKQAKINAECFATEKYGVPYDPNQTGPNPDGSTPTGGGTPGTMPGGCQDEACVQAYCQANPGACGAPPQ